MCSSYTLRASIYQDMRVQTTANYYVLIIQW